MVDIPGALLSFSQAAVRNIQGLDAIQKTLSNPQAAVQANITSSATQAITTNAMYQDVAGFMSGASDSFVTRMTNPSSFSPTTQQASFTKLFGSFLTEGSAVTGFLGANAKLEDIIPAQQLYGILNNLGVSSLYSDPLQAYVQVNTAAKDLCNLAQEALRIIDDVETNMIRFLTVQLGVNYSTIQQMDFSFFATAKGKAAGVQGTLSVVVDTFYKRGRFDPAEVGAFCVAANALTEFVSFADTKTLELNELRQTVSAALQRLQALGEAIATTLKNVVNYVPSYLSSVVFGKVFQAVQGKVLNLAGVDIQGVLTTLEALSTTSVDDMTKLGIVFNTLGTVEAIRAFVCYLSPSTEVVDPSGPLGPLKLGYDGLTAKLFAKDPTALFKSLEAHITAFIPMMNTAVTRNNATELSTEWGLIAAILTPLALLMSGCCSATVDFSDTFAKETAGMGDRLAGVDVLYTESGLDAGRDLSITSDFDKVAVMPIGESTTPGQLAAAIAERIKQLPDGQVKDNLQVTYDRVYARHRATVFSMDFQRRQELALSTTLTRAEEEQRIIKEEIDRYGG